MAGWTFPELYSLYRKFRQIPVASISDAQRKPLPWLNWNDNALLACGLARAAARSVAAKDRQRDPSRLNLGLLLNRSPVERYRNLVLACRQAKQSPLGLRSQ